MNEIEPRPSDANLAALSLLRAWNQAEAEALHSTATGTLAPADDETRGAAWYTQAEVHALAERTLAYARGQVGEAAWEHNPGLEPVWLELLTHAGLLDLDDEELALARRLYTTPPTDYWSSGRLVPATDLVAR